ncbi:hypothetical protein IFR05_006845 [Cadophora sp. M221]|nr:hypothetical protein IFR05_006845 [Cadophora sp. M221]
MEDSNMIARLFPADEVGYELALQAILMSENGSRYMPPQGATEPHCGSRESTASLEDDKGREQYHHFKWNIGGVSFRIDVSTHDENLRLYNANVDRFLQQATANEELPLGIFSIQSCPSTAAPSGAQSTNQGAIRLKQETLGRGTFAAVRCFWDVSTELDYAYKEPINKRKFREDMWNREIEIMHQISLNHVVKLIESTTEPSPQLVLEYVPCGSLEGLSLTIEESMMVLYQGLSALQNLHGRKDPIVHRDIKPANILLKCRDPLYIKLADFGLSRAQVDFTTICGTPIYLAPEVWRGKKYTPVVDIWSLGVVAFECAYDFPDYDEYRGKDWCELLVDQVNYWDNDDLISILSNDIIIMVPKSEAPSPYSKVSSIVDPGTDLQPEESVLGIDLFGQHWLQDPNYVGSTVAAMEKESRSDLSGWESWPSATSVPRTMPQSIGIQNGDDYLHQGQEHLVQNSYAIDTWHQHHDHQSEIGPSQNRSIIGTRHQERVETEWTSEEYVAARLLQGMHEGWI